MHTLKLLRKTLFFLNKSYEERQGRNQRKAGARLDEVCLLAVGPGTLSSGHPQICFMSGALLVPTQDPWAEQDQQRSPWVHQPRQ